MRQYQLFCLLIACSSTLFEVFHAKKFHKITSFQGERSILSQDALLTPFPLKTKKDCASESTTSRYGFSGDSPGNHFMHTEDIKVIVTADKASIKDGGNVTLSATIIGANTTEEDYFTIQCGPVISPDDIIEAVSPSSRNSSSAQVKLYDLTFLRCDYNFSYVHVDDNNSKAVIGAIVVPSEDSPTAPKQPHLVYSGETTKMRVMYVSSVPFPVPSVKYWPSSESEIAAIVSLGTSSTYHNTDMCEDPANKIAQNLFRDPGFTHTVEMSNLTPDTFYHYRVGNEEHGWSDVLHFRSAPRKSRPVRFVAFGDQDITEAGKNTSFYVKKEVEENGSEFTLHFGDLGYAVGRGWVWDRWSSLVSPGAAIAPYMVSVGNHELDHVKGADPSGEPTFLPPWWTNGMHASSGECGVPTFVRWGSAIPDDQHGGGGKKMWYSFDWGNVHIIMMDSEHDWQYGSKQHTWLDADLAAVNQTQTPWIVVTSHRTIYTTQLCVFPDYVVSKHMRKELDPLFEKYHVNLALVAHLHGYERTCLIKRGECVEKGGTQHITVGSAGASLDKCGYSPILGPYSKTATNQWGYLRLDVTEERMKLEFVLDADGSVWDSYEVLPWESKP